MKVFSIDDIDCVAAKTKEEAIEWYENEHDVEVENVEEVKLDKEIWTSVPDEEMREDEKTFVHDNQTLVKRSYAYVIERNGKTDPYIISTSEI